MLPVDYISLRPISNSLTFNLDEPTSNNGTNDMKKYFFLIIATTLLMSSCVKEHLTGNTITQTFDVPGQYTKLSISNNIVVKFSNQVQQIEATADEGIMPNLVIKLVNGELKLYRKNGNFFLSSPIEISLPYNDQLRKVNLSGVSFFYGNLDAAEIEIEASGLSMFEGNLIATEIEVELSGESSVNCRNLSASKLELEASGASKAMLIGSVIDFDLDLSGASKLETESTGTQYAFECQQCECELSGASIAYFHCDGTIKGDLSGASEIHYSGNANTYDCHLSGSSKVVHEPF